jgi:hypothetical protein
MGEYNLISPAYYLLKYCWYYYRLKSLKSKTKTIAVEQTYDKEEDFVHLRGVSSHDRNDGNVYLNKT